MGTAVQPSYLKDVDVPGDKLSYGDFSLRFLVDENLENYMAIHNWLTGLAYPETAEQFKNLTTNEDLGVRDFQEQFSDGSLHILNILGLVCSLVGLICAGNAHNHERVIRPLLITSRSLLITSRSLLSVLSGLF